MSQIKSITLTLAALCLIVACANSAPTDTETSSTTAAAAATATASSAPTTPVTSQDTSSTASMAVSSAQDTVQPIVNTSFTCYNRKVGYYADMEADCKVYHFCMLGDYNGQEMYQRVSYLCLNGTIFDQQALDCVEPAKITGPCAESEKHYEDSNAVLRKAIVGKPEMDEHAPAASEAPATSGAPASEAPTSPATTSTSTTAAPTSTQSV